MFIQYQTQANKRIQQNIKLIMNVPVRDLLTTSMQLNDLLCAA